MLEDKDTLDKMNITATLHTLIKTAVPYVRHELDIDNQ